MTLLNSNYINHNSMNLKQLVYVNKMLLNQIFAIFYLESKWNTPYCLFFLF